jgi:hypothetical protein
MAQILEIRINGENLSESKYSRLSDLVYPFVTGRLEKNSLKAGVLYLPTVPSAHQAILLSRRDRAVCLYVGGYEQAIVKITFKNIIKRVFAGL